MKVIFVNAFKTWLPSNWITAIWTRGKYSHCEFLFEDGRMFGASFTHNECQYSEFEPHDKYEIHTIDFSPEEEEAVKLFCDKHEGKKYDYRGLFGFVFKSGKFDDKDRAFCSEIMSEGLNGCTKFQSSKKPHRMSPVKLHKDLIPYFVNHDDCTD